MTNRIYYGEYTLKHWVKLMLTKNVVLPDYQRHFVWQERDVIRLIQSLFEGQFVQPITIALYNDGVEKYNLILDGQQRLTSILLAYLGYFPDKKKFHNNGAELFANEDDSASDDNVEISKTILWQYPELLHYGNTKTMIVNSINGSEFYSRITNPLISSLDEDFFNNTYLGFSYVVPETTDAEIVQQTFSKLFRNINYFGKKLDAIESRKSLYYQNKDLTNFFEGKCNDGSDVLVGLTIKEDLQPNKIDFVRYLSILSQYSVANRDDAKDVMVGYSAYSSREGFYADYVSYILGIEQEERSDKFDSFKMNTVFPSDCWKDRFELLKSTLLRLKGTMSMKTEDSFSAWYEADCWLFGLIYHILFMGKSLRDDFTRELKSGKKQTMQEEITHYIKTLKDTDGYSKNANRLGYVRIRLVKSCEIIGKYVQ